MPHNFSIGVERDAQDRIARFTVTIDHQPSLVARVVMLTRFIEAVTPGSIPRTRLDDDIIAATCGLALELAATVEGLPFNCIEHHTAVNSLVYWLSFMDQTVQLRATTSIDASLEGIKQSLPGPYAYFEYDWATFKRNHELRY